MPDGWFRGREAVFEPGAEELLTALRAGVGERGGNRSREPAAPVRHAGVAGPLPGGGSSLDGRATCCGSELWTRPARGSASWAGRGESRAAGESRWSVPDWAGGLNEAWFAALRHGCRQLDPARDVLVTAEGTASGGSARLRRRSVRIAPPADHSTSRHGFGGRLAAAFATAVARGRVTVRAAL